MDGLKDQRVLKPTVRRAFINSLHNYDDNQMAKRMPADTRICDWTAVQMLSQSSVLGGDGKHIADEATFLTLDRAKRDAVITALVEKLTPKLEENLEAAKLIPETPIPTGATGF